MPAAHALHAPSVVDDGCVAISLPAGQSVTVCAEHAAAVDLALGWKVPDAHAVHTPSVDPLGAVLSAWPAGHEVTVWSWQWRSFLSSPGRASNWWPRHFVWDRQPRLLLDVGAAARARW